MLSSGFRCARPARRLWHINRCVSKKSNKYDSLEDDEKKSVKKKLLSILSDVKETGDQPSEKKLDSVQSSSQSQIKSSEIKESFAAATLESSQRVPLNVEEAPVDVTEMVSKNAEIIYSELTKKLQNIADETRPLDKTIQESMRNLLAGAVIEKKDHFKEDYFTSSSSDKKHMPERGRSKAFSELDLFSSDPLNIFTEVTDTTVDKMKEPQSSIWKRLEGKELKETLYFAPTSSFEEMIMLTEQGCHWKFPINNEIDMPSEDNESFHRHVFLEEHLQGFPEKGPIRHFMELVVAGLSKNPYITVDRKIENIEWFRNYFEEKRAVLEECEVLDRK